MARRSQVATHQHQRGISVDKHPPRVRRQRGNSISGKRKHEYISLAAWTWHDGAVSKKRRRARSMARVKGENNGAGMDSMYGWA